MDNLATTHADYSIIPIADPRGNGETIPIYSIARSKLGVIDNHRFNSTENGRKYHGIDFSINSRFRNGTQLQGGITTGKLHERRVRWTIRIGSDTATPRIRSSPSSS